MKQVLPLITLMVFAFIGCEKGNEVPEPKAEPGEPAPMDDLTDGILAAIPSADEGEFPTPEAAMAFYVDCLKRSDISSMAKVLAIKERVTHWDFKKHALLFGEISFWNGNEIHRHAKLGQAFRSFFTPFYDWVVIGLTTDLYWDAPIQLDESQGIRLGMTAEEAKDTGKTFEKIIGPTRKPNLAALEHKIAPSILAGYEAHRQNMENVMKRAGADDWKCLLLGLKLEDRTTEFEILLLKFGSNWKIWYRLDG